MNTTTNPATLVPATIGTAYEGGFYGGQVRVFDAIFAVVWAPKAKGELRGIWLPTYTDVPGAANTFDSTACTRAMADAGSALARQAMDLEIDGIKGWVLPARDVLELAYRHLKPTNRKNACTFRDGDNPSSVPPGHQYTEDFPAQTTVEAFQQGGAEAFDEAWYCSSSQSSSTSAWVQDFGDGGTGDSLKKFEACARVCRLIQINPSIL